MIRPYFGMGEPFLKKLSKYIIPIAYPGRTALPGECSPKIAKEVPNITQNLPEYSEDSVVQWASESEGMGQ